ncbi:MAG: outer membrane beta-barrel protein [Elusimicrobiota bacterium]|jgi:hypothetical protein
MQKILAAILLAISMAGAASAEPQGIMLGALALHPSYSITGTYDDNIYLVPPNKDGHAVAGGGKRGSWILTNKLGLGLSLPVGDANKFTAGYEARSDVYRAQPSGNNAISQKANGAYNFKGSIIKARLFDDYLNTQDPQFNPNNTAVMGELVARERRWQNTAGGMVEYGLGDKFFLAGDGQHTVHKYLSRTMGDKLNRFESLFGVKTGYKVAPKTRVYVGMHRQIVHYSVTHGDSAQQHVANHKDWLVDGGVEGDFTAKLKGQLQAGGAYRQHDKDNAYAQEHRITRNWTVKANLNYKPTSNDVVNLSANRGLNDAVSGGNFYVTTGGSLDVAHTFKKLTLGLNGGMQTDKYSETITLGGLTAMRRDDTYSAGAKVDYKIQEWLLAGVAYKHMRRFSVFSQQYNYKDSQTSTTLSVAF